MIKLHFVKPGLHTTVQDEGRLGYQHLGVPGSGPMDRKSASNANQLVGNPPDTPVLEITLMGPEIQFEGSVNIAIAGADLSPELNGQKISMNHVVEVKSGEILSFGRPRQGCRAYLAVAGEWKVKKWLKSASTATVQPEKFTPESIIKKGSTISIVPVDFIENQIEINDQHEFTPLIKINVTPGPEFKLFSKNYTAHFFSHAHKITNDSNRMGYRLKSDFKNYEPMDELISSGVMPGTIQVTSEGDPVVLMADAQTTGGYPRIAQVIPEDLDRLGQMKPGDELWFSMAN
ncbi:MAG: biotin-dependent carboxyltransferase family protein [Fulvivirga sp.]|nr:biotin-dependent carboxyltransferase family protein [Fulvivirga sp.]